MSLGKYTCESALQRHRRHAMLNRLEKTVRDQEETIQSLTTENDRLKRKLNGNRLVFESQSRTFEQIRRAM